MSELGNACGFVQVNEYKCVVLFPSQVDASRSVDEVFVDVCAIFGDLPKLEKKRRKKGKCDAYQAVAEKEPFVVIVA